MCFEEAIATKNSGNVGDLSFDVVNMLYSSRIMQDWMGLNCNSLRCF